MSSVTSTRGFTLFETLVATGLLVTAFAGIAQLLVLSTHLTRQASASGAALVAAQDRIETLRELPFGYDDAGTPTTATALQPSPPASLDEDVGAYVDWLDANGQAGAPAHTATFTRRWRIAKVDALEPPSIAIEVCVFKAPAEHRDARGADACLSTIRTRQP
jgi:type II secretory pathway pseudopilin PulG